MRLAADVNIIGGGRLHFPEAAASSVLDSAGASVSMLAARRGGEEVAGMYLRSWWRDGGLFGSAGCLSRGVPLSATDFLEAVRLPAWFVLSGCLPSGRS
jgi:hypothetical protein